MSSASDCFLKFIRNPEVLKMTLDEEKIEDQSRSKRKGIIGTIKSETLTLEQKFSFKAK